MAEVSTIARPYARAASELAREQNALPAWSSFLSCCAQVASHPDMRRLLNNPRVDRDAAATLFIELCGRDGAPPMRDFVRVLAVNRRLNVLPEIARQFEKLRAEAEGVIEAQLITAFEVSEAQRARVAESLKRKLGREVSLRCVIDKTLLGGAVIRAGDRVIDGSVKGRLTQLVAALSH